MRISIIIPTHNRSDLVVRALESVFAQTLTPAEVIVVDDGSTDETGDVIAARFPSVVYINQSQRGVSRARNVGLRRATGDWVAFLDSDDEWLPRKLERQVEFLRQHGDYRVCHTNELWIRNGRRVNPMKKHEKSGGWIFQRCLPRCVISPSSVLIHRAVFDDVGGFDEYLPVCEDYDLWLRICVRYPVLYLSQCLIKKYGGHADQLSRSCWGMDRFRIHALDKLMRSEDLPYEDHLLVLKTLVRKTGIVLTGARKRNNESAVIEYADKLMRFQSALRNLEAASPRGERVAQ